MLLIREHDLFHHPSSLLPPSLFLRTAQTLQSWLFTLRSCLSHGQSGLGAYPRAQLLRQVYKGTEIRMQAAEWDRASQTKRPRERGIFPWVSARANPTCTIQQGRFFLSMPPTSISPTRTEGKLRPTGARFMAEHARVTSRRLCIQTFRMVHGGGGFQPRVKPQEGKGTGSLAKGEKRNSGRHMCSEARPSNLGRRLGMPESTQFPKLALFRQSGDWDRMYKER